MELTDIEFSETGGMAICDVDPETGDVIINIPDNVLKALNLSEGDWLVWESRDDGSFLLKKKEQE